MTADTPDPLRFRLDVPEQVRAGDVVPVALRVENPSDHPVELYLRGRTIAFDVVVARADGRVVWRRLEGEIIPAILQIRVLGPGEVLELRTEWDQRTRGGEPAAPGSYVARGVLPTDAPDPLATPPAPLRIVPK